RTRWALHGAVGPSVAYRRRLVVYYHDRLAPRDARVPARIHRVPRLGLSVSAAAPCRTGVAQLLYRRSTACVRSCRHGKRRTRRALHSPVGPSVAYRRRLVIYHHDRLAPRNAGVTARVHRVPRLGLSVSTSAPCRTGVAQLLYRRATARVTRCRHGKARTRWAFHSP